jgi:hypothetical protein
MSYPVTVLQIPLLEHSPEFIVPGWTSATCNVTYKKSAVGVNLSKGTSPLRDVNSTMNCPPVKLEQSWSVKPGTSTIPGQIV